MNKDLRRIAKALEAQGFEVEVTKRGHLIAWKDGHKVVTFSGTPSDWRSLRNGIAKARRFGFIWPPRE